MKKVAMFFFIMFVCFPAYAMIGKYQLVSGKYSVVNIRPDRADKTLNEGLYKIDTETGKVWEYIIQVEQDKDGKVVKSNVGWSPLVDKKYGTFDRI